MFEVYKDKEYQLVVDTEMDLIFSFEKRYGYDNVELVEIEITDTKDILKLYNQIGEILGFEKQEKAH